MIEECHRQRLIIMLRDIVEFDQDEEGDWFASLDCGHRQHTRHNPPMESRPWVLEESGRNAKIGESLDCVRCDRLEIPDHFEAYRTLSFTTEKLPDALRKNHTTKAGVWGRIKVVSGSLVYTIDSLEFEETLAIGDLAAIPPEVPHRVALEPDSEFELTFLRAV